MRVKGLKIRPKDFLDVGQVFQGQATGSEHQQRLSRDQGTEEEKRVLDWYDNVQVYRGDLT